MESMPFSTGWNGNPFEEINIGWNTVKVSKNEIFAPKTYVFHCFDLKTTSDDYAGAYQHSCLLECLALPHHYVTIPLLSYTLLSLLSTLNIWDNGRRPSFVMSLTGSTEHNRNNTALLFANQFQRSNDMRKNDFRDIHIMPEDELNEVYYKISRAKDCVLIAFSVSPSRCRRLYNIYTQSHIDDKYSLDGLLLLLQENPEDLPTSTVNIHLPDDYSVDAFTKRFFIVQDTPYKPQEDISDIYQKDLYHFTNYLCNELNDDNQFVYKQYNAYLQRMKNDKAFAALTENAQEVAFMLCFALHLYCLYKKDIKKLAAKYQITDIDALCKSILIEVAKNAFPRSDDVIRDDIEQAKEICRDLDSYFEKKTNHRYFANIGAEKIAPTEIKVWCDNERIYIPARTIGEILKLQGSKHKLTPKIKRAWASQKWIAVYMVGGKRPEYSVHCQKPLYGNQKSKSRFIAFNRSACTQHNLFPNIEAISCPMIRHMQTDLFGIPIHDSENR